MGLEGRDCGGFLTGGRGGWRNTGGLEGEFEGNISVRAAGGLEEPPPRVSAWSENTVELSSPWDAAGGGCVDPRNTEESWDACAPCLRCDSSNARCDALS